MKTAIAAEKFGFDSIWSIDHFIPTERSYKLFDIKPTFDILQAWPVLAALAALTKRVRLGTCVSPLPAYNPAVLAKLATTVDIISKGRLIFGAGAGYHKLEFKAYNFPWEEYKERMQRAREGVEIIKKLWTEPTVTYSGKYFKVENAISNPKPVQKPHPPIWFGGESARIIKVVAELGDGWLPAALSAQDLQKKISLLKTYAEERGRNLEEIELGYFPVTNVSLNAEEAIKTSKRLIAAGEEQPDVDIDSRLDWGVHGSPDMAIQQIEKFLEAGVQHFVFHIVPQRNTIACMKLLAEKVIPQ
ncbi:MAG: LLM class flavin-dependent oxidoreductase, partial [Candidatus Bathyarchaeia archaeon]